MHTEAITERVGNYIVTALTQFTHTGKVTASVSIRRGKYDRIFRFIRQFDNAGAAQQICTRRGALHGAGQPVELTLSRKDTFWQKKN